MRRRNTVLAVLLLVAAVVYFVFHQTGYALTEKQAIRSAGVYSGQSNVFAKPFGDDNIVLLSNGSQIKAQIVHRKWGFLYKPGTSVEMAALEGHPNVRYAWFSIDGDSHDGKRDIVFAAESTEDAVKKVVISNDKLNAPKDAAELKANASVYVELDLKQTYSIEVQAIDEQEIGSFVIRGLDADGRIVAGT
ncbi:hypothetical protein GXP70_25865 [Paenibacillus lycopersici]|uniref:Uncharacterized protein n=1 Tax=Paenibacillus lycopersici TaxID=2704462 RepID=A0A6C0G5T5_9BACL|nr:hypothetical protein [Paenibacillus lycopersici]QHT63054.1 hypothetical protein GXP70_25865 [Paenibacillus lycopersici]